MDGVDGVDGALDEPAYTTTPVPCFKDSVVVYASAPGTCKQDLYHQQLLLFKKLVSQLVS